MRILRWDFTVGRLKQFTIMGVMAFSPLLCSSAGIYYLGFLDNFVSSIPFSLGAVIEYYVFVYMFPFSELQKESEKYVGEKAPKWIESLI